MKKLFCFNNFWSKSNIFFPKKNNNLKNDSYKIKYKQINYYTKNFQLPFFYPILEYSKYYPNFSRYKGKLFKESEETISKYDFQIEVDKKATIIVKLLSSNYINNNDIIENCCLIKNTHHVSGTLSFIKKQNKKKKILNLFLRKQKIKRTAIKII